MKTKLLSETQHSGDLSYQLSSCRGDLEQLQAKASLLEEERNGLVTREVELKYVIQTHACTHTHTHTHTYTHTRAHTPIT